MMRRTRKWLFVKQEAQRLADLGLSGNAIAKKLGVNQSSVSRWVTEGKLQLKKAENPELEARRTTARRRVTAVTGRQTPEEWAATIRADYQLDATDDQLVTMAVEAIKLSSSPGIAGLAAMGRFQALVKQLALVARRAPEQTEPGDPPPRRQFTAPERSGRDPRAVLTAVK